MDEGKKGSSSNQLTCGVCKIDFHSKADYALHEFSKKHCDNLIRLAKQKPVVSKQKTKNEISPVEKQPQKVNSVTHSGSFAKYGYFVPGEIYIHSEIPKEFNTEYDPYLQKFAENPFKEKSNAQSQNEPSSFCSVTSFSKKKKKKVKTCQVCNATFLTLPEYKAHMKSPQHIWKLKVTGVGVSAHFVKASTDLHTTDINEEFYKTTSVEQEEPEINSATAEDSSSAGPFPLLYCSDCELLLNSPQQYNAHINGKLHIECAQKKAELKAKKEKLENPSPNQLYCFTCKISLNNLFQYNEHKNGKKHKTKCRTLIRNGITIPPEERVPGIPHLNTNKPVVYPELYEKLILEKQKQQQSGKLSDLSVSSNNESNNSNSTAELPEMKASSSSSFNFTPPLTSGVDILQRPEFYKEEEKNSDYFLRQDILRMQAESNSTTLAESSTVSQMDVKDESGAEAQSMCNEKTTALQVPFSNCNETLPEETNADLRVSNFIEESQTDSAVNETQQLKTCRKEETKSQMSIITDDKPLCCSICNESFLWQSQLDTHLGTEDHLKKILELKLSGKSESEILKAIFSDRNFAKPNISGKFSCSICSVTTDNSAEFGQHLNSIVHKYTEKDYKKKKTLEVKYMVQSNENGLYFCKLCQEGWASLVDYAQHLHFVKHKSIQRAHRTKLVLAKRKNSYLQKQRLMQNVRKKNFTLRRVKTEKNPRVRTKVCGVATDLCTGSQAPVPNLEPLEPKIDVTKNISLGVGDDVTRSPSNNSNNSNNYNNNTDKLRIPKMKKRNQISRSNRRLLDANGKHPGRCPFIPPGGTIPPLMSRPPYPRYPRPGFIPPNRNWAPFSSPQPPPVFGPFCGTSSPMGVPYFRAQRFLRPPWPRYRPPFPHS